MAALQLPSGVTKLTFELTIIPPVSTAELNEFTSRRVQNIVKVKATEEAEYCTRVI